MARILERLLVSCNCLAIVNFGYGVIGRVTEGCHCGGRQLACWSVVMCSCWLALELLGRPPLRLPRRGASPVLSELRPLICLRLQRSEKYSGELVS